MVRECGECHSRCLEARAHRAAEVLRLQRFFVDFISKGRFMSKSIQQATRPGEISGGRKAFRLVLVAGIVLLSGFLLRGLITQYARLSGVDLNTPMPEITAAGWLNGAAVTPETLRGKVVVIDFFATWCGPCMAATPELVETAKRFQGKDVVFLGLTTQEAVAVPALQAYVERFQVPWVIGYGAEETKDRFKTDYIPRVWVVNKSGQITWDSYSRGTLEEAITAAL